MSKAVRNIATIRTYSKTPDYEIVIPTAGMGNRMKCYGPKSLIKIKTDLTIMQHQFQMINKHLRCDPQVIVVSGFQAQKVMNSTPFGTINIENENYETTNVARSIGMGLRATKTNHVIIIYGDLVFNKYALTFPVGDESVLVVDTHGTMTDNEVGCTVVNKQVQQMWYDLPNKWAQIVYLTGIELALAKAICWHPNYYNCFGFEVINEIIKRGGKFTALRPHKLKVNDIDSIKDIPTVKQIL